MLKRGNRRHEHRDGLVRDRRPVDVRKCRVCGCTDADCRGCIARTGRPCHWIEWDLCSACEQQPRRRAA